MQTSKKTKLVGLLYKNLSFEIATRIISFWHHSVEVESPRDWIKLFGKKNGEYRQIYTRVSFERHMSDYDSVIPANSYLQPFKMQYPVAITSITAKTHFSEQFWLSNWNSLQEIILIDTSSRRHKISQTRGHAKKIFSECKIWPTLRSFSIRTFGLVLLGRYIHYLSNVTSLDIEVEKSRRHDWDPLLSDLHRLSHLRCLTLTFSPPAGKLLLPMSLVFLSLQFQKSKSAFVMDNLPNLQSLMLTQMYQYGDFSDTVQRVMGCFKTNSLHAVGFRFNKMKNLANILKPDIMPSSVTSCTIEYTNERESHMNWFENGQVQFRAINIDLESTGMINQMLAQVRYQQEVEVLSLSKLDITSVSTLQIKTLGKLKILRVRTGIMDKDLLRQISNVNLELE